MGTINPLNHKTFQQLYASLTQYHLNAKKRCLTDKLQQKGIAN